MHVAGVGQRRPTLGSIGLPWTRAPTASSMSKKKCEIILVTLNLGRSEEKNILRGRSEDRRRISSKLSNLLREFEVRIRRKKFAATVVTHYTKISLGFNVRPTAWPKAEQRQQEGHSSKPQVCIEPWDAGKLGSEKWEPNKYAERIQEFTAIGVTHIPVMLSSIGRKFGLTRTEFIDRLNEYADLMNVN